MEGSNLPRCQSLSKAAPVSVPSDAEAPRLVRLALDQAGLPFCCGHLTLSELCPLRASLAGSNPVWFLGFWLFPPLSGFKVALNPKNPP